jgi:hypothetical protein
MAPQQLHELLADGLRYGPHYLPSMNADHLPMTLAAMTALGATNAELVSYRDDYKTILREIPQVTPASDWESHIGEVDAYPEVLGYLRQRINREETAALIREIAPRFMPGLAADAFHPLIRLAYASAFESEPEVAAALAYMVTSGLRDIEVPVAPDSPVDLASALKSQVEAPLPMTAGPFGRGLRTLLKEGRYNVGIAKDFETCAALSMDIYRSTRNFFALHMVTATQAARIVALIVDEALVLASLTGALLAAHRVVGSPDFDREMPAPIPDRVDREHTFKYLYACTSEFSAYGDQRYIEEVRGFKEKALVPDWAGRSFLLSK